LELKSNIKLLLLVISIVSLACSANVSAENLAAQQEVININSDSDKSKTNLAQEASLIPQKGIDIVLSQVKIDGKWGFINKSGKLLSMYQFDEVFPFSNGLSAVNQEGKWGFLSTEGKVTILPQFDEVHSFNEDLAVVKSNNIWCVINMDGKVVIQLWRGVSKLSDFSKGLAAVKIDGKWGYMNKDGKLVIQPSFNDAGLFLVK